MDIINDEIRLRDLAERNEALRKEEWDLKALYRNEFIGKAEIMDDDRFWKGVEIFKENIDKMMEHMKDTSKYDDVFIAIRKAAEEFARKSFREGKFVDFISFARTYSVKSGQIYDPCFENITGCGDDGYGDFCDRLPLVSKEVYDKAIAGELKGDADNWPFKSQHELYVSSSLDEAVENFLPSFIRDRLEELAKGTQSQSEEEDSIKTW